MNSCGTHGRHEEIKLFYYKTFGPVYMAGMFTRIITKKNGRQYLYAEERYRDGGKVRSRSRCLGPVDGGAEHKPGFLRAQFPRTYGIDWDKIEQDLLARADREKTKANEFAAKMHAAYGMTFGTSAAPIEKVTVSVSSPATSELSDRPHAPDTANTNQEAPAPSSDDPALT